MHGPAVPQGVIKGIEDLVNGDTATKEEIDDALDVDGINVNADITGMELNRIDDAQFTTAIEENDGESINMIYETVDSDFVGFSIHMDVKEKSMIVEFQEWVESTNDDNDIILERKN